jgi:hypothetical protein
VKEQPSDLLNRLSCRLSDISRYRSLAADAKRIVKETLEALSPIVPVAADDAYHVRDGLDKILVLFRDDDGRLDALIQETHSLFSLDSHEEEEREPVQEVAHGTA